MFQVRNRNSQGQVDAYAMRAEHRDGTLHVTFNCSHAASRWCRTHRDTAPVAYGRPGKVVVWVSGRPSPYLAWTGS